MPPAVVPLDPAGLDRHADALAALLQETVADGGGIGFLHPVRADAARHYWASVRADVQRGERVVLALVDGPALAGCVQLALATRETGLHRADVQKLMVRRDARRRGHATRLMEAVEAEARARGRTLLLLDTFTGSAGDALYAKLGWTRVGEIPRYALRPHGGLADLVLYCKELAAPPP